MTVIGGDEDFLKEVEPESHLDFLHTNAYALNNDNWERISSSEQLHSYRQVSRDTTSFKQYSSHVKKLHLPVVEAAKKIVNKSLQHHGGSCSDQEMVIHRDQVYICSSLQMTPPGRNQLSREYAVPPQMAHSDFYSHSYVVLLVLHEGTAPTIVLDMQHEFGIPFQKWKKYVLNCEGYSGKLKTMFPVDNPIWQPFTDDYRLHSMLRTLQLHPGDMVIFMYFHWIE